MDEKTSGSDLCPTALRARKGTGVARACYRPTVVGRAGRSARHVRVTGNVSLGDKNPRRKRTAMAEAGVQREDQPTETGPGFAASRHRGRRLHPRAYVSPLRIRFDLSQRSLRVDGVPWAGRIPFSRSPHGRRIKIGVRFRGPRGVELRLPLAQHPCQGARAVGELIDQVDPLTRIVTQVVKFERMVRELFE